MECEVIFEFDDRHLLGENYQGETKFSVMNPPIVPRTCDVVYFEMEDFINDPEALGHFKKKRDGTRIIAEEMLKVYGKEQVTIYIALYLEDAFKELCPKLYAHSYHLHP